VLSPRDGSLRLSGALMRDGCLRVHGALGSRGSLKARTHRRTLEPLARWHRVAHSLQPGSLRHCGALRGSRLARIRWRTPSVWLAPKIWCSPGSRGSLSSVWCATTRWLATAAVVRLPPVARSMILALSRRQAHSLGACWCSFCSLARYTFAGALSVCGLDLRSHPIVVRRIEDVRVAQLRDYVRQWRLSAVVYEVCDALPVAQE